MKWLTVQEVEHWRASVHPPGNTRHEAVCDFDPKLIGSFQLAREMNKFFSGGGERLIWIRDWETYPPEGYAFMASFREALGESRPLIEAPGALFAAHAYTDEAYEDRSSDAIREEALLCGVFSLAASASWTMEMLAAYSSNRILIADQRVTFHSDDRDAITERVRRLAAFS